MLEFGEFYCVNGLVISVPVIFTQAICFSRGYDSWKPTLAYMMRESLKSLQSSMQPQNEIVKGTLFVVTAYTYEECEDDADVIAGVAQTVAQKYYNSATLSSDRKTSPKDERIGRIAHQLWAPEYNFFSSRMERKTASGAAGRRYFENGAWQAWLFDLV